MDAQSPGMDSRLYISEDEVVPFSWLSIISGFFMASRVCRYVYEALRLDEGPGLLILLARKRRIRPLRKGAIVSGSCSR